MRLYFIFLLSIILLAILPIKSSIIIEEPIPETPSTPRVLNIDNYEDGTIVVRIVRLNYTAPPKFCLEENLSIRTIYPNGTVKGFDLSADTLNIQPFNFCLLSKFNPLRFYPVKKNFLFLTYAEAEDVNNPFTYNDWGMIIDLDGVIKSKFWLGTSFVNTTTNEWLPAQDSIRLNIHRDNGFLRTAPITSTNSMILQQFKVNENGEIQLLAKSYMNFTAIPVETVATMDGGYAIIYPGITPSSTIPFAPYISIHGFFLQNGNPEPQGPFVLYQTPNPVSKIILLDCGFTKVGFGQTCILVLNVAPATDQNTFIKMDFLSTGTVYNITIFQNPADLTDFAIMPLDYGGYLLFSTAPNIDKTKLNLYGYILDDNSKRYNWNISYPTITNFIGDILILPNNTLVIPQPESGQTWGLITTDLYKIEGARDHGYGNLHIFNTTPIIGDTIDPSGIESLTIKFYSKVNLSPYRNVTILQDGGIIRQITSVSNDNGNFVEAIDDYTIKIKVIDSTFNQPNTKYYVLIDDGFVESKDLQEPIIGIQDNAWNFNTTQQEVTQKSISTFYETKLNESSINGKVRLTAEGTTYFKSFKHDKIKRKEFFDNLTQELAKAVPVGPERITTNERHEIDTSVSPEQYILSINIKRAKNSNDSRSVNLVASDLNTLIKYKLITVIGSGVYTIYLDEEYGYEPIPRWLEEHLSSILGTIGLNIILLLFAYWNKTFAIYTCGNAIEKFVTTILFTSIDAGSVENIFTTSLFFVTFPFIVNLGFAFKVVIDELMGYDFQKLLENIKKLNDLVKKGNNSTVEVNDRKKKFKKLIRETRKELIKIEEEVSDLKKDVNEILKNPVDDVKTKEKLVKIIDHITKLVDISGHLDELWKLLELNEIIARELNKIVARKLEEIIVEKESEVDNKESEVDNKESEIDNKEVSKVNEGIVKKFANELIKIHNLIIKELKKVKELNEQLNKAVDLIVNESKEEPPMSENELTTSENEPTTSKNEFMSELKKLKSFKKELEELKKLESFKKKLEELKENNEESNGKDSIWIKIKKLFSRLQEKFEEIIKAIEKKRPPKKYRKLSKWLRDYKDNQTIVIIFTILAGVDISHLELLGSQLQIPNINYFGLEIRNINFNAELSQAAENSLFWGDVTNIFIEDVSTIFIQCFYLSQVVSFGYTPIYTISKSIIHLINNVYHIHQYNKSSDTNPAQ
ncbi:hypothetical protein RhiirA5_424845 [Rhizophagus irregularis]|uniref:SbsA Ig-like domain-containing protein n=1 Tax=Rhizophagus irregularis TaxID=588596 RepID=A0A2N0P7K1_9GLOM|nr:hypothetical protein RhiirA5_424845 [Rhizophagus irregularis]